MLVEMEGALRSFLYSRGYWDERVRLGEWRYQSGQALEAWSDAGWGAYSVAWIHYARGENEKATFWAEQMTILMERSGNRQGRIAAISLQAMDARKAQNFRKAKQLSQEALELSITGKHKRNRAASLITSGGVAYREKHYEQALTYFQQALDISEQSEIKDLQAVCIANLGLLNWRRNNLESARSWYEQLFVLAQEMGRMDMMGHAHLRLARILKNEGNYTEALETARIALNIWDQLGDKRAESARNLVAQLKL